MSNPDYTKLVVGQRTYFQSGATRPAAWWIGQLNAIKAMISENRELLYDAPWHDLRRNRFDADLIDVEYNVKEAQYALDHLHGVDKDRARAHALYGENRDAVSGTKDRRLYEVTTSSRPSAWLPRGSRGLFQHQLIYGQSSHD